MSIPLYRPVGNVSREKVGGMLVCPDTNTIHPAILTRLVFYMEACDSGSNGPGLGFFGNGMYMSHELSSSMGWMCVFSLKSPSHQ